MVEGFFVATDMEGLGPSSLSNSSVLKAFNTFLLSMNVHLDNICDELASQITSKRLSNYDTQDLGVLTVLRERVTELNL